MNAYTLRLFLPLFLSLGLLKFAFDAPAILKNIIGSMDDAIKGKFNGLSNFGEIGANAKKAASATFGRVAKGAQSVKKGFDNTNKAGRGLVGGAIGLKAGAKTAATGKSGIKALGAGIGGGLRGMVAGSQAAQATKWSWMNKEGNANINETAAAKAKQAGSILISPEATKFSKSAAEYGTRIDKVYNSNPDIEKIIKDKDAKKAERDSLASSTQIEKTKYYNNIVNGTGEQAVRNTNLADNSVKSAADMNAWAERIKDKKEAERNRLESKYGRSLTADEKKALDKKWGVEYDLGNGNKEWREYDEATGGAGANRMSNDQLLANMNRQDLNDEIDRTRRDELEKLANKYGLNVSDLADVEHNASITDQAKKDKIKENYDKILNKYGDFGDEDIATGQIVRNGSVLDDNNIIKNMAEHDRKAVSDSFKANLTDFDEKLLAERVKQLKNDDDRKSIVTATDDIIKEQITMQHNKNAAVQAAYEEACKRQMASFAEESVNSKVIKDILGYTGDDNLTYDQLIEAYNVVNKKDFAGMSSDDKKALFILTEQIKKVNKRIEAGVNTMIAESSDSK